MYRPSDPQGRLFSCENVFLKAVGEHTFYGLLATEGRRLFPDEKFASMYSEDNGRPCTPPSLLAKALLLQMYDRCSDAEAARRAQFDIQWKVALCVELDEAPFGRSTLQEFRARVHLHEKAEGIFKASVEEAVRSGLLRKGRKIKVALDTTPVFGRGAVKDTYSLVADGIRGVCSALAATQGEVPAAWAERSGFGRYWTGSSLKGDAQIDWSSEAERRAFLNGLVADVDLILCKAASVLEGLPEDSEERGPVEAAIRLLRRLLEQDVDRSDTDAGIKQGVAPNRVISVHDPEMRHGRKSESNRFDGHKASVAVDADEGVILAVDVIPGNAPDSQGSLQLTEEAEATAGVEVDKTIGDCAYGDGATRQQFEDAGRHLVAKIPSPPADQPCHKANFIIDLTASTVTCPGGHTTNEFDWVAARWGARPAEGTVPVKRFQFPGSLCSGCPLKDLCVSNKRGAGRSVLLHPQEGLLQEARAYQQTDSYREDLRARQTVEHRLARLMQLGMRHARYFGRAKTKLQLMLTAAVANLTLAWARPATL